MLSSIFVWIILIWFWIWIKLVFVECHNKKMIEFQEVHDVKQLFYKI